MDEKKNDAVEPGAEVVEAPEAAGAATEVPDEISAALEARASFYETLASLYFMPLKQSDVDNMAAARRACGRFHGCVCWRQGVRG